MSSQRKKPPRSGSSSSSSPSPAQKEDRVKLSFHEMLSYGHKPWDEDYRQQKQALEEAFTQAHRQAAAADAHQIRTPNQQISSVGKESGHSTVYDDDSDYGVKPVKFSEHEMLCYGHKPWDNDYYEWKEAYEKAFTKADRQAAAEARREASASKAANN